MLLSWSATEVQFAVLWTLHIVWHVLDYFLEDIVQMLDFTPPPSDRKRRGGRDDDDAPETEDKDEKQVQSIVVSN